MSPFSSLAKLTTVIRKLVNANPTPHSAEHEPQAVSAVLKLAKEALVTDGHNARAPDYPVDALGPLAETCRAIASEGQVELAMAGQALLLACPLLLQARYSVRTLGGEKPISLYGITEGLSGDGKTSAESIALRPVRDWERQGAAPGEQERRILVRDATVPAILRLLEKSRGSLGLCTSEGATIFGGHSMNKDNLLVTAGQLNGAFDDGELSYSRVSADKDVHVRDRYLTMSLMAQPVATATVLTNETLANTGLLARCLLCLPPPSKPRKARPFHPEKHPAIVSYWNRAAELLGDQYPSTPEQRICLEFEPSALDGVSAAFEHFEWEAKEGGMQHIRPFGIRATELLCRIAAVLAAYGGHNRISLANTIGARQLVDYSLACWSFALSSAPDTATRMAAFKLAEYVAGKPGYEMPFSEINRSGPKELRSASVRNDAVALLVSMGLAERIEGAVRLAIKS